MTEPVITYKPGWAFTWGKHQDGGRWLNVRVGRPDSKGFDREDLTERSVDFSFLTPMPFDADWLWNRVVDIERHEIREWLRIDGQLEFDPHVDSVASPDYRSIIR